MGSDKATIGTLIDANLASGTDITAIEHREVEDALNDSTINNTDTTTQPLASSVNFAAGKGVQFNGGDVLVTYSSGTWTPTIPGLVLNVGSATWRRWGDMCYVECSVSYTSGVGSGSSVGGSPFPSKDGTRPGCSIRRAENVDFGGVVPNGLPVGTSFSFGGHTNNAATGVADFSTFTAMSNLQFSAVFQIEEV